MAKSDSTCPFTDPDNGIAKCFIGIGNSLACQSIGRDFTIECSQFEIIITKTFKARCVNCDNLRMNNGQGFRWIKPSFPIPERLLHRMGDVICPDCQPAKPHQTQS